MHKPYPLVGPDQPGPLRHRGGDELRLAAHVKASSNSPAFMDSSDRQCTSWCDMRSKLVRLTVGLVLVVVAACSTVQVAYDNADWFLLRQMDDYLDLDSTQKAAARELLEARMERHRREELPQFVEVLRDTRSMLADGLTEEEVDWIFERAATLYRQTMSGTIPAMTPILATLTPSQIDRLEEVLHDKNRDFQDEYIPASLAERHEDRTERAVDGIEFWTGSLSDAQVVLVARQRKAMPQTSEDWLAYNIQNQQRGLFMLRSGAGETELRRFLEAWWVDYADVPPDLEAKLETAVAGWKSMLLQIDQSASREQRERVLGKLDAYIEDLDELTPTSQAKSGTTSFAGRATGNT